MIGTNALLRGAPRLKSCEVFQHGVPRYRAHLWQVQHHASSGQLKEG